MPFDGVIDSSIRCRSTSRRAEPVRLRDRWRSYLQRCREARLRQLEQQLGRYTMWGSGPYGASSEYRRAQQIEVARLRQQLGLPQESNWLIDPILQTYGIDTSYRVNHERYSDDDSGRERAVARRPQIDPASGQYRISGT